MSKAKMAQAPIKVLWMDDRPKTIATYKNILDAEKTFDIDIATSIREAYEKLTTAEGDINVDKYEAFVADCRMDEYAEEENGAKFLKEMNELEKAFPMFVYSTWAEQPIYKKFLDQSYVIFVESKLGEFDSPLSQNQFFKLIHEHGRRFQAVKNLEPEKITFSKYCEAPDAYQYEVAAHWEKHGHWITQELTRRQWLWGVVCAERMIDGSGDLFQYPNEDELIRMGEEHNLIPFAYSQPVLPEDSPPPANWNRTLAADDYYPTLNIKLGDVVLEDDFDTGALQTLVAEELVKRSFLDAIRDSRGTSSHLGEPYQYRTKQVKVTITDSDGAVQTKDLPVAVVQDWGNSPFVKVNPHRRVLLGRDILRAFKVEVCLDSQNRITRIRFL